MYGEILSMINYINLLTPYLKLSLGYVHVLDINYTTNAVKNENINFV